jgi:hypothetical protein
MSVTARWIVGIAGLPFAVTGLVPFTGSARQWTALALGAIVGGFGLAEAIRTRRRLWAYPDRNRSPLVEPAYRPGNRGADIVRSRA